MQEKRFTLSSDFDGIEISGLLYEPQGKPKGIVQIVHGICEHKARYLPFLKFLASQGYVAECHDHRGHGESVKEKADLGWFGDYDGVAIVEDTCLITRYLKTQYPNLPVTLFGYSMGALIACCYLQKNEKQVDKVILCGLPEKNRLVGLGIFSEKCIRLLRGSRYRSKILFSFAMRKAIKKFQNEGICRWLTRDEEVIKNYLADPKCAFIFTCNGMENLFKLLRRTYQKKEYLAKKENLPILSVAGGEDPIIGNELKWFESIEFLRGVGYKQVQGKLYQGMRHEILSEIGKEEVYANLLSFLEK